MRSLCIAEAYPWPALDGYKLRLAHMVEALGADGPVDFLCLDGSDRPRDPAPDGVTVIDARESPELGASTWMPAWIRSPDPRRLVRRDFSEARRVIPTLDQSRYDLTFYSHVASWRQTHDLIEGPAILDFVDLEHVLVAGIRRMGPASSPTDNALTKARAAARWVVASGFNLVDERRWDRIQQRAGASVDRVFVCSADDVARSGCANAVSVPNGYERQWVPADHAAVNDPDHPVFLFVGLMGYEPNIDAARWFAAEILPLVRAQVPGAEFRIVGRHCESVQSLGELDGVTVVGEVDSLEPEMIGADVSVVPLRSGSGTRLKVVEAMANRLPMVSTAVGCEGIDVRDGEHLLIADAPVAFARACVRAVTDLDGRSTMIDAAEQCFVERYQWSSIRAQVAAIAAEVSG